QHNAVPTQEAIQRTPDIDIIPTVSIGQQPPLRCTALPVNGYLGGKVVISRTPDFIDSRDETSKRLRLVKGEIVVRDEAGNQNVSGQITGLRGICVMPDKLGVVTNGQLQGYVDYKAISRDHLLFSAESTFTPKIEVSYECSVE